MPDQPTTTNWILSSIVTFLGGGFVGAILNHFLSGARDRRARKHALDDAKESRKRDFLSFMSEFRSQAERTNPLMLKHVFSPKVHEFRRGAAKVRLDLDGEKRSRFDEAVTRLCQLRDSEITYKGQERVTEAIDAVVKTLD